MFIALLATSVSLDYIQVIYMWIRISEKAKYYFRIKANYPLLTAELHFITLLFFDLRWLTNLPEMKRRDGGIMLISYFVFFFLTFKNRGFPTIRGESNYFTIVGTT